jgi:hypothetical protein
LRDPASSVAHRAWTLVGEPVVDKRLDTIDERDDIIGKGCVAPVNEHHGVKIRVGILFVT